MYKVIQGAEGVLFCGELSGKVVKKQLKDLTTAEITALKAEHEATFNQFFTEEKTVAKNDKNTAA